VIHSLLFICVQTVITFVSHRHIMVSVIAVKQ